MSVQVETVSGRIRAAIEPEITIYNAVLVKERLMALIDSNSAVDIDLSAVNEIDTAGLQVLLLAKKEGMRRNKDVRLINSSLRATEIVNLLNTLHLLNDDLSSARAA